VRIIVGLGNPGPRYRNTRHNVGFRTLDVLAEELGTTFSREKYGALIATGRHEGTEVLMLKPLTFMNNSGVAVAQAARNKVQDPGDLLVVSDDVNLPLGRLRLRKQGSAGGHNGLKSIIERLGTSEFGRLRIGVGQESVGAGLIDHVLGTFAPDEWPEVNAAVGRAAQCVLRYIAAGMDGAMNEFNRPPDSA
jgi:peptidyl-tRNA hydrolase, PTH1 family